MAKAKKNKDGETAAQEKKEPKKLKKMELKMGEKKGEKAFAKMKKGKK